MSFSKSFFAEIESELGHTPIVEVVEPPAQMEGIGDAIAGIGKKLGKDAAIGALAFGAANAPVPMTETAIWAMAAMGQGRAK